MMASARDWMSAGTGFCLWQQSTVYTLMWWVLSFRPMMTGLTW